LNGVKDIQKQTELTDLEPQIETIDVPLDITDASSYFDVGTTASDEYVAMQIEIPDLDLQPVSFIN
jgi:hypothetical protein